jgi:hypothetical protein
LPVDVDCTGAAQTHAASKLGARQAKGVAEYPEQRHLRRDIDILTLSIDRKIDRRHPNSFEIST